MHSHPSLHQSKRINQAVDAIIRDPAGAVELQYLADSAYYSRFHFHRLFKNCTGQTPADFVWQHRLDRAAGIIAYHRDKKLVEVSEACGFSSAANFSRAFRRQFGMPARAMRGNIDYLNHHYETVKPCADARTQLGQFFADAQRQARAHARTEDQPLDDNSGLFLRRTDNCEAVYLRNFGQYLPNTLDAVSNRLHDLVGCSIDRPRSIGIPRSHPGITARARRQYDICYELRIGAEVPADLPVQTLQGGLAAVFRCEIELPHFYFFCQKIWGWLYNEWLP
ncbi:MAG: AraC family transcriptional regulator, partial [Pseudomonadota bacterium]